MGNCEGRLPGAGAKVVAKASAEERVGVFVRRGGALQVVEYSELSPEDASATEAGEQHQCKRDGIFAACTWMRWLAVPSVVHTWPHFSTT